MAETDWMKHSHARQIDAYTVFSDASVHAEVRRIAGSGKREPIDTALFSKIINDGLTVDGAIALLKSRDFHPAEDTSNGAYREDV